MSSRAEERRRKKEEKKAAKQVSAQVTEAVQESQQQSVASTSATGGDTLPLRERNDSPAWVPFDDCNEKRKTVNKPPQPKPDNSDVPDLTMPPLKSLEDLKLQKNFQATTEAYDGSAYALPKPSKGKEGTNDVEDIPLRTSFADQGSKHSVVTNHFKVNIQNAKELFVYHVGGLPDGMKRTQRNVLIQRMITNSPILSHQQEVFTTDGQGVVVAWRDLRLWAGENSMLRTEKIPENAFNAFASTTVKKYDSKDPKNTTDMNLCLNFSRKIDFKVLQKFVNGGSKGYSDPEIAHVLDLIFASGSAVGTGRHIFQNGTNRYFCKSGRTIIDSTLGLAAIRGYFFSTHPAMGNVLLNLNTATSAFHMPETVLSFMERTKFADSNGKKRKDLEGHLIGLRVRIMYSRADSKRGNVDIDDVDRRTRSITGFGRKASDTKFDIKDDDGKVIKTWNVYDYLKGKYGEAVKGTQDQIVVNVGNTARGKETWFLPEHLHILAGQKYSKLLEGEQTQKMLDFACRNPDVNRALIMEEGLDILGLTAGKSAKHGLAEKCGIQISSKMLAVPARKLEFPAISYTNGKANLDVGSWSSSGQHFQKTSDNSGTSFNKAHFFAPLSKDKPDLLAESRRGAYVANFLACYSANGIGGLSNDPQDWASDFSYINFQDSSATQQDLQSLKDEIQESIGADVDLAVLILPNNNSENQPRYAAFKVVCDQILGLTSICLCEAKMAGSIGGKQTTSPDGCNRAWQKKEEACDSDLSGRKTKDRILSAYMGGVALKLNLRLGKDHANHYLAPKGSQPAPFSSILSPTSANDVIILGADVLHLTGSSIKGTPSIAAVVGSVDDHFASFPGSIRFQTSRQEIIDDMQSMVKERIDEWMARNSNRKPKRIIYYRDGIDEGSFSTVKSEEEKAIKRAYESLFTGKPPSPLQLTTIIVSKRHNTRFFAEEGPMKDHDVTGNCVPGTVVEQGITSPLYNDFFLQSHRGTKGTAKPTHYFVISNGMDLDAKAIQDLTYNLCYAYQRSTKPVSYATPAYYADHLAERGKAYLRPLFDNAEEYKPLSEGDPEEVMKVAAEMWKRGDQKVAQTNAAPTMSLPGSKALGKTKAQPAKERKNPWHPNLDGKMFWL